MKICKLPYCHNPVIGRSDKKYCCDEHRSDHHNEKDREMFVDFNKQVQNSKRVYKCLIKLYRISRGRIPVDIDLMYEYGFKKDICYNAIEDPDDPNIIWFCIEDYAFRQISETQFLINKIKHDD